MKRRPSRTPAAPPVRAWGPKAYGQTQPWKRRHARRPQGAAPGVMAMASSSPRADGGGAHAAVDAPNLLYHLATAGAQRQAENDEKRLDAVAAAALAWVERFEEQTSYSVLLVREGTAPKAKAPVQQKAKAAPAT